MKNITELTKKEAEELLDFFYPKKTPISNPKNYDYWVEDINFTPTGLITFGGNDDTGIKYRGGLNNDGYVLPFNDTKVIYWLYINGYDVKKQLEENIYLSKLENDFYDCMFKIQNITKDEKVLNIIKKYYYD